MLYKLTCFISGYAIASPHSCWVKCAFLTASDFPTLFLSDSVYFCFCLCRHFFHSIFVFLCYFLGLCLSLSLSLLVSLPYVCLSICLRVSALFLLSISFFWYCFCLGLLNFLCLSLSFCPSLSCLYLSLSLYLSDSASVSVWTVVDQVKEKR